MRAAKLLDTRRCPVTDHVHESGVSRHELTSLQPSLTGWASSQNLPLAGDWLEGISLDVEEASVAVLMVSETRLSRIVSVHLDLPP